MKGLIIFPPVHDFSMPYLAGPLLKGYVEHNDPSIRITCVDLNLEYFISVIKNYSSILEDYREALNSPSPSEAVGSAIYHQNLALTEVEKQSNNYKGHGWSLRNYRSPFDRQIFSECLEYSRCSTPFDQVYLKFFNQHPVPDFFSVSLTVEDQILPTFRLLYLARINWPSIPIILGGNLLNRIGRFMNPQKLKELCDILVLREGEIPFLKVLKWIRDGGTNHDIDPRIIFLNSTRIPTLGELNDIPNSLHTNLNIDFQPDFSDLNIHSYLSPKSILPILMSRKCYWGRCDFCTIHSAWDPSHRRRSANMIFQELETNSKKYIVNYFRVVDEACPPDLLLEVSNLIQLNSLDIRFEIYGILEQRFLNKEYIKKIANSGCRQIFFGLESTDPKTIKHMSKEINRTYDADKIFASTAGQGIHNYTFTMYGFPDQDLSIQNETINYIINEKNIHTAVVSSFAAELEAPYTVKNLERFIHNGKMTEKFSECYIDGKKLSAIDIGVKDAERAQREIYTRRPDLAITALLYDETRFVLSDKFGPDFAQQFVSMNPNMSYDINKIIKIAADERIRRKLT